MTLAEEYPEVFDIVSEANPEAPWTLLIVTEPGKPDAEVLLALLDAADAGNQIRIIAASVEHLMQPVLAALRIVRECRNMPSDTVH